MRLFVRFEAFEALTRPEDVARLREVVGRQLEAVQASGRLQASGMFADGRGGFLVLEAADAEEVFRLLGSALLDHCRVETRPLLSLASFGELLQRASAA